MRALWPALSLALLASLALATATILPKPGRSVIVFFPSSIHADGTLLPVLAAGLMPLRPVRLPWPGSTAVLAQPEAASFTTVPQGAWFVIDAGGLKGCD